MVSSVDRAKRALVSLLIRLAKLYSIVLDITRDSADVDIRRAFKKVSRKAHPDRGGSGEHQQTLNDTHAAWEQSQRDAKGRGRGRQRPTATPHICMTLAKEFVSHAFLRNNRCSMIGKLTRDAGQDL